MPLSPFEGLVCLFPDKVTMVTISGCGSWEAFLNVVANLFLHKFMTLKFKQKTVLLTKYSQLFSCLLLIFDNFYLNAVIEDLQLLCAKFIKEYLLPNLYQSK